MEVRGQLYVSVALTLAKETQVTTGYEAGWAPEPVWTLWWKKKFPAPFIQPAAQRYTAELCTSLFALS
jgi:hypothetical protein